MSNLDEIELQFGDVRALVAPGRGSIVTSLSVRGTEALYMDRATFEDESRSVHGGIPLLFPFASTLANNTVDATGTKIPIHGFGREMKWKVVEQSAGVIRMRMKGDDRTREIWPWAMTVEHTVMLMDKGIHHELMIFNAGTKPMPVAPGWHPYFRCPASKKEDIEGNLDGTNAGSVHDREEVNFGVTPRADGTAEFAVPELGKVVLRFAPIMRHVQLWTLPGKDYICLEPFTGPPNYLNTPEAPVVPPGRARVFWARFEIHGAVS